MGSGRNSNPYKLLWLSLLPARMNTIQSKMKALECSQNLSHYKFMEIFFRRSSVANSADLGPILPNFESIQAFIAVIVTCKNKEDPMKNGRARVLTRISPLYSYVSYLLPWKPEF